MQSLWLIVPLFFLIILILPLIVQIKISYDAIKNNGVLSIKILFIRIFLVTFKIKEKSLILRTKKKAKQVELALSGKEIKLVKQFTVQMKDKIKLKKLEFHSRIGLEDAFHSAMLSASISSIICAIFGYIKNFKETTAVDIVNHTSYNSNHFIISLFCRFSISIFDILYSFIMASIIIKRSDSKHGYVPVKKEN